MTLQTLQSLWLPSLSLTLKYLQTPDIFDPLSVTTHEDNETNTGRPLCSCRGEKPFQYQVAGSPRFGEPIDECSIGYNQPTDIIDGY